MKFTSVCAPLKSREDLIGPEPASEGEKPALFEREVKKGQIVGLAEFKLNSDASADGVQSTSKLHESELESRPRSLVEWSTVASEIDSRSLHDRRFVIA